LRSRASLSARCSSGVFLRLAVAAELAPLEREGTGARPVVLLEFRNGRRLGAFASLSVRDVMAGERTPTGAMKRSHTVLMIDV